MFASFSRRCSVVVVAVSLLSAFAALGQGCPSQADSAAPTSPIGVNFPVGSNITFKWSTANTTGVVSYEVDVLAPSSQSSTVACTGTATETSCTAQFTTTGTYTWAVKTRTSTCTAGVASQVKQFTMGCLDQSPTIGSPNDGAQNIPQTPTLSWSTVPNADSYDIYLGSSANGGCTGQPVATTAGTSFTPPQLAANTVYEWKVVAKKARCADMASSCSRFQTGGVTCVAPDAFDLKLPVNNGQAGSTPTLVWTGANGAFKYLVHIGTQNPPPGTVNDPLVSTNQYQVTTPLSAGTYFWYVDAYPNCSSQLKTASTSVFSFTVRPCPTGVATLVSPASGASLPSTSQVTFDWSDVSSALSYDVLLSTDGGTTFGTFVSTPGTTSTATKSMSAGSFVWEVRANFDAGCGSTVSQSSRFTVTQNSCPTSAPTLVSPTDGAKDITVPVTFNWTAVSGATGYKVFVLATTSGGNNTSTLVGETGPTTTRLVTSSIPTGTVTWWVTALFDNCPSTESNKSSFTTATTNCPTTAPTLSSPSNGASDVTSPLKFSWSSVNSAIAYRLWVAVNGGTASAIATTADNTFSTTAPEGTYEWYVEALFDKCAAIASSHFRFTIPTASGCPSNPGSPTLTSPADGATGLTSPVTLQWSAVTSAKSYVVYASVNGAAVVSLGTTTSTQLSAELPAGSVTWFVVAKFGDDCSSTVSSRATFNVSSGTVCNNASPTLTSPANGAGNVQSPVTFDWSDVKGAVAYRLYVGVDGATPDLAATTTDSEASRIVSAGTIDWYVEALFAGCSATKSSTSRFTVVRVSSCDGKSVSLSAPADGSSVTSPVTLQWTNAGATYYRVWLGIDGGTPVIVAATTDTKTVVSLPSGAAEWYVEAVFGSSTSTNAVACSVLSSHGKFTIARAASCNGQAAPTPTSPTGTLTADKVTFQWAAAPGAAGYRVWASANNQPFSDLGVTKDTKLVDHTLAPATYIWFVDAIFENCPAVSSAKVTFVLQSTTPRCSNDAPTTISPASGAQKVASPVTFLWSAVANAVEYRLYGAADGGDITLVGVTQGTSLERSVPPEEITWFVEAVFKDCPSTKSQKSKFSAAKAQDCRGDKPTLIAPPDGAQSVVPPVTFNWTPVSNSVGYALFAKRGDGAPTQIGTTQGGITSLERNMPDGKIEWWVVAFPSGCAAVESAHFTFTIPAPTSSCEHRKPITLAPADGAQNIVSPVHFSWSAVAGATSYKVHVAVGDEGSSVVATTKKTEVEVNVPDGVLHWAVSAIFDNCPPTVSAVSTFNVLKTPPPCREPEKPTARVVGQAHSGTTYNVRWTPLPNVAHYELQESTKSDFSSPATQTLKNDFAQFSHPVTVATQFLYRVRGISSCSDEVGPWSDVVGVFIIPPETQKSSTEVGAQGSVVQKIELPPQVPAVQFSATTDKPWLTVTPAQGILGDTPVTLVVTSAPGTLNLGTNTGTVLITYSSAGKKGSDASSPPKSVPISVSIVTPVQPVPRNTPQPTSLIIPGIAHAAGANNSLFQSDVRVTNIAAQTMRYLLNFTPAGTDGTQVGSSTTIEIEPGATTALDDILSSFFGGGSAATGSLEIRELTTGTASGFSSTSSSNSSSLLGVNKVTVASSRTYNVDPKGTYGQFIPAIPFSEFINKAANDLTKNVLSLQQVAASSAYRTNIGLVEAAGEAASVLLHVYDDKNNLLADIPVSLQAGEFKQANYFASNNLSFTDGRVELEVTSATGRVTAYASTIDNRTNDPLLVSPVLKSAISANRYILPGISHAAGANNSLFRSDVRIYNGGTKDTTATITYVPMPGQPGAAQSITLPIKAGEVGAFDDILAAGFNVAGNSGGALLITTSDNTSLVTSARTYNVTETGTLGQFIPGVTSNQSVAGGDRPLQILQLEQSDRYRTNIGLAETTGKKVDLEVSLVLPDTKVTPVVPVTLEAGQFIQFPMTVFNAGTVYNARISVKVVGGSGRATAYGSVIDQATGDPTYVPAQ
jgi:hypothetical protein